MRHHPLIDGIADNLDAYEFNRSVTSRDRGRATQKNDRASLLNQLSLGIRSGNGVIGVVFDLCQPFGVVVTFSAGNLAHIASTIKGRAGVIADNDVSGTGQSTAVASGLPWAMSDTVGEDANDLHQRAGLAAVEDLIRAVMP